MKNKLKVVLWLDVTDKGSNLEYRVYNKNKWLYMRVPSMFTPHAWLKGICQHVISMVDAKAKPVEIPVEKGEVKNDK